mmetsp:Transcript_18540/g.58606  ORF Transcript_18540/g.58606 Transcript_18540/m.58606 type:complete len:401 (+) Transcript_18540:1805-3007(+)
MWQKPRVSVHSSLSSFHRCTLAGRTASGVQCCVRRRLHSHVAYRAMGKIPSSPGHDDAKGAAARDGGGGGGGELGGTPTGGGGGRGGGAWGEGGGVRGGGGGDGAPAATAVAGGGGGGALSMGVMRSRQWPWRAILRMATCSPEFSARSHTSSPWLPSARRGTLCQRCVMAPWLFVAATTPGPLPAGHVNTRVMLSSPPAPASPRSLTQHVVAISMATAAWSASAGAPAAWRCWCVRSTKSLPVPSSMRRTPTPRTPSDTPTNKSASCARCCHATVTATVTGAPSARHPGEPACADQSSGAVAGGLERMGESVRAPDESTSLRSRLRLRAPKETPPRRCRRSPSSAPMKDILGPAGCPPSCPSFSKTSSRASPPSASPAAHASASSALAAASGVDRHCGS